MVFPAHKRRDASKLKLKATSQREGVQSKAYLNVPGAMTYTHRTVNLQSPVIPSVWNSPMQFPIHTQNEILFSTVLLVQDSPGLVQDPRTAIQLMTCAQRPERKCDNFPICTHTVKQSRNGTARTYEDFCGRCLSLPICMHPGCNSHSAPDIKTSQNRGISTTTARCM